MKTAAAHAAAVFRCRPREVAIGCIPSVCRGDSRTSIRDVRRRSATLVGRSYTAYRLSSRYPVRDITVRFIHSLVAIPTLALVAAAPRPLAAQDPQIVLVRATDYKFEAPPSISAGATQIRLDNQGREIHHLWVVQLKDGHTFSDFTRAMDSWNSPRMPSWVADVGGPNDVAPGRVASA